MSQIAPTSRPDLEDEYWSKFNAWQFLQAAIPQAGQKPEWKAINTYPIARRAAQRGKLVAIRPKTHTHFLVFDLDALSRYHPLQNPFAIAQLQHTLEVRLGLTACIAIRSSDSNGIHLWYWFDEAQNSYRLAEAVRIVLQEAGFAQQPGHLETFPNCKAWIDSDDPNDWSQYHAIRVPLLEPGSYLLNSSADEPLLHPFADQRQAFLRQIEHCQQRNDLTSDRVEAILATQPKRFKKVSVSGNQYLNDLLDKVRDGWDGHGQTNQLLFDVTRLVRIFGHLLFGSDPYWETERLAVAIHDYILDLPGREQFCAHNHELRQLAQNWAKWVQTSKYKPYGYGKKPLEEVQQSDTPTHNQKLQQTARERIINAIALLLEQGSLPPTTIARIEALEALGIKRGTLYRHRDLWHPDNLLDRPETPSDGLFTPVDQIHPDANPLKPNQEEEFTPITYKELDPRSAAPLEQAHATNEIGGSGGNLVASADVATKNAQLNRKQAEKQAQMQNWLTSGDPILEAEARCWFSASSSDSATDTDSVASEPRHHSSCEVRFDPTEPDLESTTIRDLGSVIAAIDVERLRLCWQPEDLRQYCLDQFACPRDCLHDDDLISLLLALRQLE